MHPILTEICPAVAPYPWTIKKDRTKWTQEMRNRQAAILKRALPLERKAIGEIEQALAAIDAEGTS